MRGLWLAAAVVLAGGLVALPAESEEPTRAVSKALPRALDRIEEPTGYVSGDNVRTVDEAVEWISAGVDVPVVLPANLPRRTKLARSPSYHEGNGSLRLALPGRRPLSIQYGHSHFDGCGPLHPRKVRVGRVSGVIETTWHRKGVWSQLTWPSTPKRPEGRYGLSGPFTRTQILGFARSMEHARVAARRGPMRGC